MATSNLPALPPHLHVHLRELAATDARAWSSYLSLPGVIEHTSWGDVSPAALQQLIATCSPDATCLRWALLDRDGQLMGTVGLNDIDRLHHRAELAYDLSPACRGRGLATEAARAIICWARNALGCVRIQATVLDSNQASIAVLERVGMRREGLLHAYRQVRGRSRDFWMYASTLSQPAIERT